MDKSKDNSRNKQLISFVDFAPAMLDISGIKSSTPWKKSFSKILENILLQQIVLMSQLIQKVCKNEKI